VAVSVWLGSCGSSWLSCLLERALLESLRHEPRPIVRSDVGPGMLGPVTPHRAVGGPYPLSLPGSRPLQAFLPPEPLHQLIVQLPDLPSEHPLGHPTAPAQVVSGDLAETMPQLGLLLVDDLAGVALGAIDFLRYLQRTSHGVVMA